MKISIRQKLIDELFEQCRKILHSKGTDYSGEEDSLSNFKKNAERLGLSKYQIWLVYFNKHIDSVQNSIKRNPDKPQVESEPLEDRIKDIINYAALLYCMIKEDEGYDQEDGAMGPFPKPGAWLSPEELERMVEEARRNNIPPSIWDDFPMDLPPLQRGH